MTDGRIDGQLLTLGRVVATAAPPRSEILAIVERNRVRRTRARRRAGALAAVAVVGTSAMFLTVFDGGDPADISADLGAGPDIAGPEAQGGDVVVNPDVGGDEEGVCGLAGPDPAHVIIPDDVAGVGDVLEARFPSCFGGIVRTGPNSADLFVIDLVPEVKELAQQLLGPNFAITALPSDHALKDIEALKVEIDEDAGQLHAAGVDTWSSGVRITSEGPRVMLGIDPYSPEAVERLEELYGANTLLVQNYGPVHPG
jgi:hypothetical protein